MSNPPAATDARPVLAISMGDPGGIGPEVVVKALSDPARRAKARFRIFGTTGALMEACDRARIDPFWWRVEFTSDHLADAMVHDCVLIDYEPQGRRVLYPRAATTKGGDYSYRFVEDAITAAEKRAGHAVHVDGIVTGPISKQAWAMAGRKFPGHTELLARRFLAKRVAMMFEAPRLRVTLVTVHIPLLHLMHSLTIGRVFDAIDLTHQALKEQGIYRPRIAVCGLNPHAGEEGLIGAPGPAPGHRRHGPVPGRHHLQRGPRGALRRRGRHVPRPGADPGQAALAR
jgi:4-hydroxythreonine-4-phosphate dehydrogenase